MKERRVRLKTYEVKWKDITITYGGFTVRSCVWNKEENETEEIDSDL